MSEKQMKTSCQCANGTLKTELLVLRANRLLLKQV